MKKNTNNKTLKIVAATAMSVFSLFSVFMGTYAWFISDMANNSDGNDFGIETMERLKKVSYYQHTGTATESACSFSKTPYAYIAYNLATKSFDKPKNGSDVEINGFNLELESYDPMNKYKPVLMVVELDREYDVMMEGAVSIVASTTTADFMGSKNALHQPKYSLDGTDPNLRIKQETVGLVTTDYYPMSSVVGFKSFGMNQAQYNTWATPSNFNVTTANTETPDRNFAEADSDRDSSSFVQTSHIYNSTPKDFSNEKTYSVGEYVIYNGSCYICTTNVASAGSWTGDSNWEQSNKKIKYIAVVIDYNDAAIEYIYSTYLGDRTIEDNYGYVLNYICDWIWEIS